MQFIYLFKKKKVCSLEHISNLSGLYLFTQVALLFATRKQLLNVSFSIVAARLESTLNML